MFVSLLFASLAMADEVNECLAATGNDDCVLLSRTFAVTPRERTMLTNDCDDGQLCQTDWQKIVAARQSLAHEEEPLSQEAPLSRAAAASSQPAAPAPAPAAAAPPPPPQAPAPAAQKVAPPPPPPPADPCVVFQASLGTSHLGGSDVVGGARCFGNSAPSANREVVLYNDRVDPSLLIASAREERAEENRNTAYVVVVDGLPLEEMWEPRPGLVSERKLIEVTDTPQSVLALIQATIEIPDGRYLPVSKNGMPEVSALVGEDEARLVLPSFTGHIELYKFARADKYLKVDGRLQRVEVWSYVGHHGWDYDQRGRDPMRLILSCFGDWST